MRHRLAVALLTSIGLMGLGGIAPGAGAVPIVDPVFVGVNGAPIAPTNTVNASPGDVLTMALFLTTDQPLTIAIFSLNYDLDGKDELDVVSQFQWF